MKTLYESILDNDDVLFDNIKKDLKNPFILLYNLFNHHGDLTKESKQDILDILYKIDIPRLDELNCEVYMSNIWLKNDKGDLIFKIILPSWKYEKNDKVIFAFSNLKGRVNNWFGSVTKTRRFKEKLTKEFNLVQGDFDFKYCYYL